MPPTAMTVMCDTTMIIMVVTMMMVATGMSRTIIIAVRMPPSFLFRMLVLLSQSVAAEVDPERGTMDRRS